MLINSFLHDARSAIEETLRTLIEEDPSLPFAPLFASARYSLLSSAKRLRPLLVLATLKGYGCEQRKGLAPACALEMIHTYSLIHDDLPCMDDDDMRRGQPSLHKMYPEWHALLTGDYLLTYAFEVLSRAPHLSADQKLALITSLSLRAGAHGMIGGQMIDLLSEQQTLSWESLEQMHRGKTAGLIITALEFGGIIAEAPREDILLLQRAGEALGIAFQLIDDILDHKEGEKMHESSEQSHEKTTATSLIGIEKTKAKADLFLKSAQESLNALSRAVPLLHALFAQMIHRQS